MRPVRLVALVLAAISFSVVLLAFAVPALAALAPAFGRGNVSGSIAEFPRSLPFARIMSALRFTLVEALLSAVVAVLVGIPAALLVARRNFPFRRFLLSLSGVPLCVPPVIIALAFVLFYGRQGYLNVFLMSVFGLKDPPVTFLYSLAGVVIAHGFYNFPVVLRTVSVAWERLDEAEEESALLLGAGRFRVFRTITLPALSGAILSSAVLVFLYCFFSFVIVLLFGGVGGTTLEVELYQAARSSLDFRAAGFIATVETLAALGIVIAYARIDRHAVSAFRGGFLRERKRLSGIGERFAAIAYLLFIAVFFVGPLVSIVARSFLVFSGGAFSGGLHVSPSVWLTLFGRRNFLPALLNTVTIALAASAFATVAAIFFAFASDCHELAGDDPSFGKTRSGFAKRALALAFRVIPLMPLAVSSVMLGFGWTLLAPRGNGLVLALAQAAIAWPFAWTQIRAALSRVPRSVRDAARLLSPNKLDVQFRVLIPLVRKGILSGAAFVFAISAGDATLPLVLSIRQFENLPLMLFRLAGSYRFSEACACAVFLGLLTGFVFFMQDAADRGERGSP